MVNYVIENSEREVKQAYTRLLEKLDEHTKVLALNDKPFTSIVGIKRNLLRLKPRIAGNGEIEESKETKEISGEEMKLINEILDCLGIDVAESVKVGLIGEREMRRTIVRYHYHAMAKRGMTYKAIKELLSEKYKMSVSAIEKLIYSEKRK